MVEQQVTVQQYAAFLAAHPAVEKPLFWEEQLRFPALPVVGVSALEADAYCAWKGMRPPTDDELKETFENGAVRVMPALWEWTSTRDGSSRVLRGGSWDFGAGAMRAAFRVRYGPAGRNVSYGFRCARCEE